jgi:hypothetical protein
MATSRRRKPGCAVEVPPTGQSPEDPIEFEREDDVACGNAQRANAEPEPAALHAAEVPGKPDAARRRREVEREGEAEGEGEAEAVDKDRDKGRA